MRGDSVKKKIIIFVSIALVVILAIILVVLKHTENLKNEIRNNNARYLEIKESTKKAVEWNIKAMYPNCPITDTFDDNSNKSGTHYNSSFLISNGYIKKEELFDVDREIIVMFMLLFKQIMKIHKIIKKIVLQHIRYI